MERGNLALAADETASIAAQPGRDAHVKAAAVPALQARLEVGAAAAGAKAILE